MLQVVPRFTGTGTCILPVPVNRNRGILTSLLADNQRTPSQHIKIHKINYKILGQSEPVSKK